MTSRSGPPSIAPERTLGDAIELIDETGRGIALVIDGDRRLVATITDGDVRRAILARVPLETPLADLLRTRPQQQPPLTAPVGTSESELLRLMKASRLRHIPIVDSAGRVVDLAALDDLVPDELGIDAVVMAGGLGTRLGALTDETPKPMLPVGDQPVLAHIVEQLRSAGIRRVHLTTHYRGDAIADYFRDGADFGVAITYVHEDEPLGTAGSLSRVGPADGPVLVMNGDILTRLDFRALLHFHEDHDADLTVAIRPYEVRVPYGLVEIEREQVVGLSEKPLVHGFVNAGIYLLGPDACRLVPDGPFDMTDLIALLLERGRRVVAFPLREYWLDIGAVDDYDRALVDHGRRE